MPDDVSASVTPGQILAGKYRVEALVGKGAMGVLVRAYHLSLEQVVAIKLMRQAAKAPEEARRRFLREAKATAKIKSEHVARVFDVGRLETGELFIVMEFLEGADLGRVLREKGPLGVREATAFGQQALKGIAVAHEAGIVHRDLKPENLFKTTRRDGTALIKVLDFGLSKLEEPTSGDSLTKTAAVFGTPLYISPEQLRDSKYVDERTDIWSFGVILYTLLAGKNPFAADRIAKVLSRVSKFDPPRLATIRADVPPELDALIARCMDKNVDRRYQTAVELADALAPFVDPALAAAPSGPAVPLPGPAPAAAIATSPRRSAIPPPGARRAAEPVSTRRSAPSNPLGRARTGGSGGTRSRPRRGPGLAEVRIFLAVFVIVGGIIFGTWFFLRP